MKRVIRFGPELLRAIQEGRKTTTWRQKPKRGIFEVALGGSWYKPNRTGVLVELEPIEEVGLKPLVKFHFKEEGFESRDALLGYLSEKYPHGIPQMGWLHKVKLYSHGPGRDAGGTSGRDLAEVPDVRPGPDEKGEVRKS